MHYHAEIWIPNGEEPGPYVAKAMEPHREEFDEDAEKFNGFWDWFQIGGRWTGVHVPDYDPRTDSRNIEACMICDGSGFRSDPPGRESRKKDPTYTCNGCGDYDADTKAWKHGPHGPGKSTKWPTSWARFDGDIIPVADVSDDLTCNTLIVEGRVLHVEEWDGENWNKTEFDGRVKPALDTLGIEAGTLVTVDYHS